MLPCFSDAIFISMRHSSALISHTKLHTYSYSCIDAVLRIDWRIPAASRWQFWALLLFSPFLSLSIRSPFFATLPRPIALGPSFKMGFAYRPARIYRRTMRAGCRSAMPRVAGGQGFCSIRRRFPALSALAISAPKPSSFSTGFTTPAAPFGRSNDCNLSFAFNLKIVNRNSGW